MICKEIEKEVLHNLYGTDSVDMQELFMVVSAIRETYRIMSENKTES